MMRNAAITVRSSLRKEARMSRLTGFAYFHIISSVDSGTSSEIDSVPWNFVEPSCHLDYGVRLRFCDMSPRTASFLFGVETRGSWATVLRQK